MNTPLKKIIPAVILLLALVTAKAQLPYSETFDSGSCNTSFPTNWTIGSTTSDWLIDDNSTTCSGGVPECNTPGSSGGSILAGADGSSSLEAAVSASFSTLGYGNITIDWNGYRSAGAPVVTLEYSFDDITYTTVPFSDVTADDAWHTVNTIALPSACDNVAKVYLRWSYTGTAMGAFIAFDDLVSGGTPLNVFYWNGGAPHLTSSWGVNLNGSGANPLNFTTTGINYNFYNNTTTNFNPTLSAAWAVSGGSVFINLGNGTTRNTNFTIPASFSLSLTGGTINVANTSTLTIANTSFPASSQVNLTSGSTIDWAQSSTVTMYAKAYSNLTISGGASKVHGGTGTSISGTLNLSSATSNYSMSPSSLQSMTISGVCVGTGSLLTGNSNLVINGTGSLGTINFGPGSTSRQIRNLTINRTSGGSATLGSELRVNGSAVFTNGVFNLNDNSLVCNGAITFPVSSSNGAFSGSASSSFSVGGSGAITNNMHMDQTSSSTRAMMNVTTQRTGAILTIDNSIEIWGAITPTVGTIATGNGNLTIKSSATAKGRVGKIGPSGDLTGTNITVETFAKGGTTGYTNLGAAGISGLTFADWNDDFTITCPTCPDGSMVSNTPFTSITAYDETTFSGDYGNVAHYVDIANVTDAMGTGKGWWVYFGNGSTTTSDIVIDVRGSINKGNLAAIPLTVTGGTDPQNGWNLLANPYPSPISFSSVINGNTGNCENTLYVWNPDLNGGNGDYAIYTPSVGSVPPVASGGIDDNIPTGQGFYLRATSAFSLNPTEDWKSVASGTINPLLKTTASNDPPSLFVLNFSGGGSKNFNTMTAININANATPGYDNLLDAHHLSSGFGVAEIFSIGGSDRYKINSLPTVSGSVNIPVKVLSGTSGAYQITPLYINNLPAGACVKLFDRFTNTTHDMRTGAYSFNFMDTTTVNRFVLTITVIQTSVNAVSNNPACTKNANGNIIASGTTTGPWNYVWKNMNGIIIKTTNNIITADTLKNLGAGTYYVDVNTVGSCDNAGTSFTIAATNPLPTAGFTANADSMNLLTPMPFTFTNTSVNASGYSWDFGDGNTSSAQQPNHAYSTEGEYIVTLYAYNTACGDTSVHSYMVKTYTAAVTDINSVVEEKDNSIEIGSDAYGVFVQLNNEKVMNATVNVYNILGQSLISPKVIEGTQERFYINVNTNEQVLLITVTTEEKRVSRRLFVIK